MITLSVTTAVLYLIGCLLLYKSRPTLMAGYLLLLPHHAYNLISLVLIESGEWIIEQERYGYINGSTLIYTTLLLFVLIGYWLAPLLLPRIEVSIHIGKNRNAINRNSELWGLIAMMLIYVILFGYAGYQSIGIDQLHRHNFLQNTYPKWLIFFLVSTYSAIGWYVILRINGFMPRVIVIVLFSFGSILYGGSFSTIVTNVVLFVIAQSLDSSEKRSSERLFFLVSFGFIAASIIKIGQEYLAKGYTPEQLDLAFGFIATRLTTQAHLIWFSVERYLSDSLVDVGFIEFLMDFFNPTHVLTTDYGLGRLMFHANNEFAQSMVDEGIGMSAGFPSIVLASLGLIPTILACALAGFFYYLMFSILVNCAKNYGFPLFIFAYYFFNQFSNIIYNGDYGFINFKTIVYLGVAFVTFALGKRYLYGRVWPKVRV